METILGKIEVIRNWRRYYKEILGSFSEIFSVKLGKNFEIIFEKLLKNVENTSHKFKRKIILMETLWNFLGEELTKYCTEISNNFREKIAEKPRGNFGNTWRSLENLSKRVLQNVIWHWLFPPNFLEMASKFLVYFSRNLKNFLKFFTKMVAQFFQQFPWIFLTYLQIFGISWKIQNFPSSFLEFSQFTS